VRPVLWTTSSSFWACATLSDADFIVQKDVGMSGMQKAIMKKMYGLYGICLWLTIDY